MIKKAKIKPANMHFVPEKLFSLSFKNKVIKMMSFKDWIKPSFKLRLKVADISRLQTINSIVAASLWEKINNFFVLKESISNSSIKFWFSRVCLTK